MILKMIGWLGEEDIKGYNWVMGEAKNGILETAYQNEPFVFETHLNATKVTYEREGEQDVFNIDIRAEGDFGESWIHNIEIDNQANIEKFEVLLSEEIENQARQVIDKMQNEFYCDIFYLGNKVKQKDYKYWLEVKEKWEGKNGGFQKAKINVNAEVKIRHFMTKERLD